MFEPNTFSTKQQSKQQGRSKKEAKKHGTNDLEKQAITRTKTEHK